MFGAATGAGSLNNTNNDIVLQQSPSQSISSLHFGPAGPAQSLLLATGWSSEACVYEVSSAGQNALKVTVTGTASLLSSCFGGGNDSAAVFVGACDGSVTQWSLAANTRTTVGQHGAGVKEVFYHSELGALVTGSWDRTVRYWDTRNPGNPTMTVPLTDRVYAMDVRGNVLVVATGDKKLTVYDVRKSSVPYRAPYDSPLKCQTRCIALFPDTSGFALGSIEGRVACQYVAPSDQAKNFAFRCHRDPSTNDVYSVNAIQFHPRHHTFATVGSDGTCAIWDKDARQRLKQFHRVNNAITATAFSASGVLLAYGVGYDWSKGIEHYDRCKLPNAVLLRVLKEEDVKKRPAGRA